MNNMNNYIKTNSNLILIKINKIIENSKKIRLNNKCFKCSKIFEYIYKYDNSIKIKESDIHLLINHNMINYKLYKKICELKLSLIIINYCLLNTNGLNIIDSLYEEGSNKIYIENSKNIYNSKINRFSEHSGFIYFNNYKLDKIIVLNDSRIDKNDPLIYLPQNSLEALKVDYIFHTHPKTPFIGSRSIDGIIYEFPSISDILHFIEHHNSGKLLGSIVITPEGIYIIHKLNFNRSIIKLDYDIFINDIEKTYIHCYNESIYKYNSFIKSFKNKSKISYFYKTIAQNFEYINIINKSLSNYDIYIDYFPRVNLQGSDHWIFPNIYVPIIS